MTETEQKSGILVRGLIATGVAAVVNLVILVGYSVAEVVPRIRMPGATDLASLSAPTILLITVVPALLATLVAWVLNRSTAKAKMIFNAGVVLVALASLWLPLMLPITTNEVLSLAVMHLVTAAALVALVGSNLRSE